MPFSLHRHVSYALVDERPIFLDLRRDRYVALDQRTERAFLDFSQEPANAAEDQLEGLVTAGLLRRSAFAEPIRPAAVEVPRLSALGTSRVRRPETILAVGSVWRALRHAHTCIAAGQLESKVEALRERHRGQGERLLSSETEVRAGLFNAARRLVPKAPRCLPDSLALADWLASRSAFPHLVFGVKLHPFAAHCWVQTDHAILNDAADTVAQFVPILVV